MDYVRHGSLVFFKAHCPCISPFLTWSIYKTLYFKIFFENELKGYFDLCVIPGDFFLQMKVLSSCPFGSQNIKNRLFRFKLFSVHSPIYLPKYEITYPLHSSRSKLEIGSLGREIGWVLKLFLL
jgi:hypothetical protein